MSDPDVPYPRAKPDSATDPARTDPASTDLGSKDLGSPVLAPDATGEGHRELTAALEAALSIHLHDHLARIERIVKGTAQAAAHTGERVPAWLRPTQGEPRWPVALTVLAAIGLQLAVPDRLVLHPLWLLPGIELVLLAALVAANPRRISRDHRSVRLGSLALVVVATFANVWTAGHLIAGLLTGTEKNDTPAGLLGIGGAIWATNVIVFALWYWDFDRGGPLARASATHPYPDFQFAQMQTPDLSHEEWEPGFLDYLYLSFTNATAFSPTDTLPLSRWAKMAMLTQSVISLVTVVLVVARAVNILV
jgi:uncharacterized membrane protein